MSDWFETVVDVEVADTQAKALADRVLTELVTRGFVQPEPTDCTLSGEGYAPQPQILKYLQVPTTPSLLNLTTNSLRVEVGRRVHVPPSMERVTCPRCKAVSPDLEILGWQDAIAEWYDGGDGELRCGSCAKRSSVNPWAHDPPAG
jgi:hypothetical protein